MPWWDRIWPIQELLAAKQPTFNLGGSMISSQRLAAGFGAILSLIDACHEQIGEMTHYDVDPVQELLSVPRDTSPSVQENGKAFPPEVVASPCIWPEMEKLNELKGTPCTSTLMEYSCTLPLALAFSMELKTHMRSDIWQTSGAGNSVKLTPSTTSFQCTWFESRKSTRYGHSLPGSSI